MNFSGLNSEIKHTDFSLPVSELHSKVQCIIYCSLLLLVLFFFLNKVLTKSLLVLFCFILNHINTTALKFNDIFKAVDLCPSVLNFLY